MVGYTDTFSSVLLQNNADPTIKNTDGNTALDLAEPICKSVLKGNIKIIIRDVFQKTVV